MLKRTYICQKCGNEFTKRASLRVVKGIRPQCPFCNSDKIELKTVKVERQVSRNLEKNKNK